MDIYRTEITLVHVQAGQTFETTVEISSLQPKFIIPAEQMLDAINKLYDKALNYELHLPTMDNG